MLLPTLMASVYGQAIGSSIVRRLQPSLDSLRVWLARLAGGAGRTISATIWVYELRISIAALQLLDI